METENPKETGEIEKSTQDPTDEAKYDPDSHPNPRNVKTKVPEVEIRLYRRGKGLIDVFKSSLGGWDQDQLEVREIRVQIDLRFQYQVGSWHPNPISSEKWKVYSWIQGRIGGSH